MSIKAQTFARVITNPMNVYNFEVRIPGVDYSLIIESTQYPNQGKFRTISLWFQGEQIRYPGLPDNGGEWAFKIPESDDGKIAAAFKKLFDAMYNQKTGQMFHKKWKDIDLFAKDDAGNVTYSVTLHGCWIVSRQNVSVDQSRPGDAWKWDYAFVYQWIEDKMESNKGSEAPL